MRLVLIADVYPPLRSSGAVQLRDMSLELARQGHEVTVLVASPELDGPWFIDYWHGVQVVRLKTPKTKDVGYARRTLGEFLMPYFMWHHLRASPLAGQFWDGVIWYSPTIFLGPIIKKLKVKNRCRSYLIIRDIFPEWAVDMGLLRRGLPYFFFKAVANYQYSVANVIGVQTPGNKVYFKQWSRQSDHQLEVLQNWLADAADQGCRISIADTCLRGRKIFVYAGNMGVAQGMGLLLDLADQLRARQDVGFVFVGRGSDSVKLRREAEARKLTHVLFFDEIEPDEIFGLYAQCHIGLVALDPRHKTHNIPGKFLSYMQSGLPVLAAVNAGNDIVELIQDECVGRVCTDNSPQSLKRNAEQLLDELNRGNVYSERCRELSARLFSVKVAAHQVVAGLKVN